jgi:hypothetical protein
LFASASQFARDAILWHAPLAIGKVVVYTMLVVAAAAAINPAAFSAPGYALPDDHALVSLDLAIVRAYCGTASSFSSAGKIAPQVRDTSVDQHQPIRSLIGAQAGSVDAFCAAADLPFVNNENSLMLLETGLLSIHPAMSFAGLGNWLHRIRIAAAIVCVGVLLAIGASLAFAFGTMCIALILLGAMPGFVYSAYPFLWLLILVVATSYAVMLRAGVTDRLWTSLVGGAIAGLIAAFTINMRTSYLPMVIAALGIFAVCAWARARETRAIQPVALFVVSCGVGILAFNQVFIRPLSVEGGRVSHSIAHPLVLSLGVPQTPFAEERDISWNDVIGPRKALAIDPTADYLGPRYSTALFAYYRSLWSEHPGEMLRLYFTKFNVFGPDMLTALRSSPGVAGRGIAILLAPLSVIPGGVSLLLVYLAISAASLKAMVRTRSPTWLMLAILAVSASLVHTEAGIIYSLFVQQYHNYAAFFVMLISLVGLQVVAQLGARAFGYEARVA